MENTINYFRKYNFIFLFFITFLGLLTSCNSDKKKNEVKKDEVMENVNYAYDLLNKARHSEESDTNIPLGFKLNSTEKEYRTNLQKLTKSNVKSDGNLTALTTDYFGWEQKVYISNFHYFSDPNTETDIVSSVTFIFDELKWAGNSKIKLLRDSISRKFDNTWQVVDYQLDTKKPNELSHYYKYWIKNNIVAEFAVDYSVTLEFHNAPKSYTFDRKHFYDEIESYYAISEKVKQELKEQESKPKIVNSPWDGSVYEVKSYLSKTLKDPDSYEGIELGNVIEKEGYFFVSHKYRAKNSFGGYVIETYSFKLDNNGNVIDVQKN